MFLPEVLTRPVLDRLLGEENPERIIEALKGHRMYPVLAREYSLAKESGSFSRMENDLFKQFYAEIIAEAESGIKGGNLFLDFIRLEIDIKNFKTLFRLRADAFAGGCPGDDIPGGALSADRVLELKPHQGPGRVYRYAQGIIPAEGPPHAFSTRSGKRRPSAMRRSA